MVRRSLAVLVVLVGGGCAADERVEVPPAGVAVSTVAPTESSTDTTVEAVTTEVGEAVGEDVIVYTGPTSATIAHRLQRGDENNGRLVFLVRRHQAGRVEVDLPVRPSGSTGWIDESALGFTTHQFRIIVSLSKHRLIAYEGSAVVLDAAVGVGTNTTPPAGGDYYIKELLQPPDPTGPYGSYAYGLSGFDSVLDDAGTGDGVIGIHGTDEPGSIGTDVSHGCIRLANNDISHLVESVGLPLGTPVEILP
jgi:lipoprotein-anchoring transpeptidase ErfK/SrfK